MTQNRVAPSSSPHSFQPGVGGKAKAPATEVARALQRMLKCDVDHSWICRSEPRSARLSAVTELSKVIARFIAASGWSS